MKVPSEQLFRDIASPRLDPVIQDGESAEKYNPISILRPLRATLYVLISELQEQYNSHRRAISCRCPTLTPEYS